MLKKSVNIYLTTLIEWVEQKKEEFMARVASNNNNNDNITLPTITPFMDRLTHAVIKETSKSL